MTSGVYDPSLGQTSLYQANMQKVMRPVVSDAGGQYALETLFTPITYSIDAIHSAGDAITNYTGNRFCNIGGYFI